MDINLPLPTALAFAAAVALVSGNRSAAATAGVLFFNWAAETAVCMLTGDYYPVSFFMTADYASALVLVLIRRSHWQSAIMGVYACQLVCHSAYALSNMGVGPTYYSYWALTYMAWVQVALIGGWIGTDFLGRWYRAHRGAASRGYCKANDHAVVAEAAMAAGEKE